MVLSLRLDATTESRLRRLARRRRITRSECVREALRELIEREEGRSMRETLPYDAWRPFIGCVRGGRPDLSTRTGEKFRELLARRRGRR